MVDAAVDDADDDDVGDDGDEVERRGIREHLPVDRRMVQLQGIQVVQREARNLPVLEVLEAEHIPLPNQRHLAAH